MAKEAHSVTKPSAAVSAIIVNFNAGDYLSAAVESLLEQDAPPDEIVVVDNASKDQSITKLRKRVSSPALRIVLLAENRGFAEACNAGMRATANGMILLLNPDCSMFPGALAELMRAMQVDPHVAVAGPLLVNPDGSEQRGGRREVPNPWQIFCYMSGIHRLMPRHPRFRNFNRFGDPVPPRPAPVPAISGACMLVRRSVFAELGGFDSGTFFLHFEDLDWCYRVTQAGHGILFVPGARVEHTQGVCSATRPFFTEYHKHRSLLRFLAKHFSQFYPSAFMSVVRLLVYLHLAGRITALALTGPRSATRRVAPPLPSSAPSSEER